MEDNFHGVLIFVIFVVDMADTKISHPYGDIILCESII